MRLGRFGGGFVGELKRVKPALLASLLLAAAPASAAAQRWNPAAPENRQMLPAFTVQNVEGVLSAIGARSQRSGSNPARPALVATFANGRRALVTLGACNSAGLACKSLSILTTFPAGGADAARMAASIQQFNRRYAFSQAFVASNGQPALQRYLTADYGFVRGNLAVNLLVFANQAERFVTQVVRPLQGR